ncbi:GNAT family N-acetyltransferase [Streptomyces sp. ZYX-F-203]|uniref:GNAT family N-acetyltransferase n=1 Tax=Streptomyces sp. HSG2 TaxID=2797167 RepID=UPI001903EB12|nr:GNAT family N-acetyltransferase [Streptomyces sp. HSG2]
MSECGIEYEIRPERPEDRGAIEALDGSFTTDTVLVVDVSEDGFAFRETSVDPPLVKVFPEDDEDDADESGAEVEDSDDRTFVAVDPAGGLVGFVMVSYSAWNRRLTIEDIEVAPESRGLGIGRGLMGRAVDFAREREAGHLWLEVTNVNAPAIRAYRRWGFSFCGLDTSLYQGTESQGEQALYMARSLS